MDWKKRGCIIAFVALGILFLGLNIAMESKADTEIMREPTKKMERDQYMEATKAKREILSKEETKNVVEETATKDVEYKFWHATTVEITEDYNTAYVVVQYTNVGNTPKEALLYTPDCKRFYSNITLNENQDGLIVFEVKKPQKGVWQILLLEEINLGTYVPYVIEKAEFEQRQLGQDEERVVPY